MVCVRRRKKDRVPTGWVDRSHHRAPVQFCFLMSRSSPQLRNFAQRLITYEANGNKSAKTQITDTFDVCEKLRPQLAILMGNGGLRALLARALTLASAEIPWLRAVHVKSNGALEGLEEIQTPLSLDELFE